MFSFLLTALLALQAEAAAKPGVIEGAVLRSGTSTPIADASVLLPAGEFGPRRTTITDGSGHFLFTDLTPGTYVIVVSKEGHHAEGAGHLLDTNAIYTATVVSDKRTQVTFRLARESGIHGRVTDSESRVLRNLTVQALQLGYDSVGRKTWELRGMEQADDNGLYEFANLAAGEYYIRAGNLAMPTRSKEFPRANASITYYPGTADSSAAAIVTLREGEDAVADFKTVQPGAYTIRGHVIDGLPVSTDTKRIQISLRPDDSSAPLESGNLTGLIDTLDPSGGDFVITGVRPGTYQLLAHAEVYQKRANSVTTTAKYDSRLPVQVREADVEGVVLTLQPGLEISGRVIQSGDGLEFGIIRTITTIRAGTIPPMLSLSLIDDEGDVFPARASNEGGTTFTIGNVSPGEYVVQTSLASLFPTATYVADLRSSARISGTERLAIGADSPPSMDVVLRSDGGSIEGLVEKAATDQTPVHIVLIPSPALRANMSRYSSVTNYGGGKFIIRNIPPGEYKIFAWEVAEVIAARRPYANADYIARYESRGVPVIVRPNATTSDLKVALIRSGE